MDVRYGIQCDVSFQIFEEGYEMGRQVRGKDLVLATVTELEVDATIIRADGNNAFTADQAMGGNKLTGLGAPAADTDAARMQDVREPGRKIASRGATTTALPACTAAGSGVGKTLTADAVGVLTDDGVSYVLNDRITVKDQVSGVDNGYYTMTTEGTAGVAFVLTRSTDADTSAKMKPGAFAFTSEGTDNGNKGFSLVTDGPIVLDTTSLTISQTSGAGQLTAGAGLTKTGDTIDVVGATNGGITVNANDIEVKADTTGGANLAAAIDKNANGIAVKVDDSTIEEGTSGQLRVKANGITASQLASGKDEFTTSSNDQTLTLVNATNSVAGTELVFLRGLLVLAAGYTLTATQLSFTAGEQLSGDEVVIRVLK